MPRSRLFKTPPSPMRTRILREFAGRTLDQTALNEAQRMSVNGACRLTRALETKLLQSAQGKAGRSETQPSCHCKITPDGSAETRRPSPYRTNPEDPPNANL